MGEAANVVARIVPGGVMSIGFPTPTRDTIDLLTRTVEEPRPWYSCVFPFGVRGRGC